MLVKIFRRAIFDKSSEYSKARKSVENGKHNDNSDISLKPASHKNDSTRSGKRHPRYVAKSAKIVVALPKKNTKVVKIGVSKTIAQLFLNKIIINLSETYPMLNTNFTIDTCVKIQEMLLKEKIDIAFTLGPVADGAVINRSLSDLKLIWCKSTKVNIEHDVKKMFLSNPVFSFPRTSRTYRDTRAFVHGTFSAEIPVLPFSSISASLGLVEAGLGVATMPIHAVRQRALLGHIETFCPGWRPSALEFFASCLANPLDVMTNDVFEICSQFANNTLLDLQ